jgi:uncharacterized OsmC-like protein
MASAAMPNVTVYVDCEAKEKLLDEVRGYQVSRDDATGKTAGGPEETLTFYADEPPRLEGDGRHPQPLTYLAGGIGTCLLANLKLFAIKMRLTIRAARTHVEMDFFQRQLGSVWDGNIQSGCREVRVRLEIESDEPDVKLLALVRNAKRGCFAENLVKQAVPLHGTVLINGREVSVE